MVLKLTYASLTTSSSFREAPTKSLCEHILRSFQRQLAHQQTSGSPVCHLIGILPSLQETGVATSFNKIPS